MPKTQSNPFNQIVQKIKDVCKEQGISDYRFSTQLTSEIIGIIDEYNANVQSLEQPDDVLLTYPSNPCLGDVINVIVHESRGSIGRHLNDSHNIEYWINSFNENKDEESLNHINKINKGILSNMQLLNEIFRQIGGLGTRPKSFPSIPLIETIETDLMVFKELFQHNNVTCDINQLNPHAKGGPQVEISKLDLNHIISNLVLNSVEAIRDDNSEERKITIAVDIDWYTLSNYQFIKSLTVTDTGPGFEPNMLKNGRCFKAWYSTKGSSRLGLGLMVAGEAANRNLLDLQILKTDKGAAVRLVPKEMMT